LVLEKSLAPSIGGVVSSDIQMALSGAKIRISTAIAGLGGRAITKVSLRGLFEKAERSTLEGLTFLDLNTQMIQQYMEQQNHRRRRAPSAGAETPEPAVQLS
jgi:pyruvate ferredoxin oxidoreductase alpha subunit